MIKQLALRSLVLVGSTLLAGCGVSGHLSATPTGNGNYNVSGTVHPSGVSTSPSPSNTTPTSNTSGTSSTSTSSSTEPSQSSSVSSTASIPTSASTGAITVTNPAISQILTKLSAEQIYGLADPRSGAPSQMIFLTAKTSLTSPPTTLRHWPPQRFQVYAVLSNPPIQLGGPNATAWIQGLSHEVHLLHKAPGISPKVMVNP